MSKLNAARERTDAKLRYAAIHLDELKERRGIGRADGSDWERAHQESFLFHLFGVRDALLQEINFFHECGLMPHDVNKRKLTKRLAKMGIQSQAFRTLTRLEGMKSSWISIAARMRNVFTHQKGLPLNFRVHVGGVGSEEDGHVSLRDPEIDKLMQKLDITNSGSQEPLEEILAKPEWKAIRIASETDCLELFALWHSKAVELVTHLRTEMLGTENG